MSSLEFYYYYYKQFLGIFKFYKCEQALYLRFTFYELKILIKDILRGVVLMQINLLYKYLRGIFYEQRKTKS